MDYETRIVEISKAAFVELAEALKIEESWSAGEIGRPSRILFSGFGASPYPYKKLVFVPKAEPPCCEHGTDRHFVAHDGWTCCNDCCCVKPPTKRTT